MVFNTQQFGGLYSQQLSQLSQTSIRFGSILANSYTERATLSARATYNKALADISNKAKADTPSRTAEVEIDFSKKFQDMIEKSLSKDKDRLIRKQNDINAKISALSKSGTKDPAAKRQMGLLRLDLAEVKMEIIQKTGVGMTSKAKANQLQSIVNTVQSAIGSYTAGSPLATPPAAEDVPEGATVKTTIQVKSLDDLTFENDARKLLTKIRTALRSEKSSSARDTGADSIQSFVTLNKAGSNLFKVDKLYNDLVNTLNTRKSYKVILPSVDISV